MKRYDMEWDGVESTFMEEAKNGKYVLYSDYAELKSALSAANEQLNILTKNHVSVLGNPHINGQAAEQIPSKYRNMLGLHE